jgi:hypothetical protein
VHLVTATVVRLVRTLAHGYFSEGFEGCPLHCAVSARPGSGGSAGTAHPRGRLVADRGHAAPVDMERPANGTRRGKWGSNPRSPTGGRPVDDVLPETLRGCYVPPLRWLWILRFRPASQHRVTQVTCSVKVPLTCRNAGRIAARSPVERLIATIRQRSSQLVENSVDQGFPTSVV